MTAPPAVTNHRNMANPAIPSRRLRVGPTAWPVARLTDDVLDAYIDWREDAEAASYAYRRWPTRQGAIRPNAAPRTTPRSTKRKRRRSPTPTRSQSSSDGCRLEPSERPATPSFSRQRAVRRSYRVTACKARSNRRVIRTMRCALTGPAPTLIACQPRRGRRAGASSGAMRFASAGRSARRSWKRSRA